MEKQLLRNSVDILKRIRAELLNNVEDDVILKLDQVIFDLETAQDDGFP